MLEAAQHGDNAFVTLTYDDENVPKNQSVSPRELSLFVKRLRERTDQKLRYFACGEYGDHSMRPHYHLALFGYPNCRRGRSYFNKRTIRCCASCDEILAAWQYNGMIMVGDLTVQSAAYIAGYVTKK